MAFLVSMPIVKSKINYIFLKFVFTLEYWKITLSIVQTIDKIGTIVSGPIPLPTKNEIYTVLKSPHRNKKSREQFKLSTHKRLIEIHSTTIKEVNALMKIVLPSGVEIKVKVWCLANQAQQHSAFVLLCHGYLYWLIDKQQYFFLKLLKVLYTIFP